MIQVFNTLTRRKEPFTPLVPGEVGLYVCGVTPYDDCHIGHLMGPVLFDAVARWLRARGNRVRFVNNITDIDDKIINRANATGESWQDISRRYTDQYFTFLKRLRIATVTDHPRCTEFIPQMIAYISDLIGRDRAYVAADGVYYDVQKQDGYGKLSGRRLDEMISGSRVERSSGLRHPADFALWKLAKAGEPSWESPWGAGRPGWHIECSVMSRETLGGSFDIHGGGDDLKFPHHENEIAQGEAHGDAYARCWMHNGLIQYEGVKVGKSDPRMKDPAFAGRFKAGFLVDTYGAATIRFLILQGHYRRPNEFAEKAIIAARTALGRLHRQLGASLDQAPTDSGGEAEALAAALAASVPPSIAAHREAFVAAMDDDFGTGSAIACLFGMVSDIQKLPAQEAAASLRLVRDLGRLIGIFQPGDAADTTSSAEVAPASLSDIMALVLHLRQHARAQRAFATSDRIRAALTEAGVAVKDAKDGATWEMTGPAETAMARVMELVIALRQQARADKDFAASDRIRDALAGAGIALTDGPAGTTWGAAAKG
ncbi:MAG: cysteine--tRNA ligase [Planctomycetes bacterium]|nr:cysteine--tRNA ligase [Planctomycetota bacterium]